MQILEISKDLLRRGVQAGIFRQDLDQDMAAVMIVGSYNSAIDLLGRNGSLEELARRLSHALLTLLTRDAES
jgi:cobalamin biosynthesis protein CbiG